MWKKHIEIIDNFKYSNDKEYIEHYSNHFDFPILSLDDTEQKLSFGNDLFAQQKNMCEILNNGNNLSLLMSIFYHWDHLDLSWIFINNKTAPLNKILLETSEYYIYKLIGFYPQNLLSENETERTLTFLFLYFLPSSPKDSLLYHYEEKVPLICFNSLTFEHFEMILFLMQKYDTFSFNEYCKGYNLNHLLIENFLDNATELFSFKDNILWEKFLPLNKINTLLDLNCGFENFSAFRDKKYLYTFKELPNVLINLEKINFKNKLEKKLPIKMEYKTEIIKI